LFFLAEYSNILIMSTLISICFLGGWLSPINFFIFLLVPGWLWLSLKVCFVVILFILIRATLPRYRYDQLMNIGWKILLPVSLAYFFFVAVCLFILF
jgi:NADH-quinone oxidoreductase subunit H